MGDQINISMHLEMMLNKRTRCEDWVASIASQDESEQSTESSKNNEDVEFVDDEFSDVVDSCEGPTRRLRKGIKHQQSKLHLFCEWDKCKFSNATSKDSFVQHVIHHITDLTVIEQKNGILSYQCSWNNCKHLSSDASEIKRHLSLHSFHTILKANAAELHKLWDIEECVLNNENKNWVPVATSAYQCRVHTCEFVTDNFYEYINHVDVHLNTLDFSVQTKMRCIWRGCCTFKCKRKVAMKIHLRSHTGEKLLSCPTCGATFATNTKYMDHCARKNTVRDESNQCQFCLRYYPNERLLRDHMRYHINSHKCSFCEMTFSTPAVLANHVRHKHLNIKPFHCGLCSFKTVKAHDYNCHLAVHEAEPRYKCHAENCHYFCRSILAFKKHFVSVHLKESGPVYKCHLCEKEYNRGPSLGTHLRTVHKLERLPGHSRFRYMENKDGYYRLQVERYESLELNNAKQLIVPMQENKDCNVVITKEDSNDLDRFFVSVQDSNEQNCGRRLITIDELDEEGNLIRSSTVKEELLVDSLPENALLMKADDDPSSLENESATGVKPTMVSIFSDPIIPLQSTEKQINIPRLQLRRGKRKLKLSDNGVSSVPDVIIYRD